MTLNKKVITSTCFGAILFLGPISGQATEFEPFIGFSTGYFINPEGVPFNGELGVSHSNGAFLLAGYQISNDLQSSSSPKTADTKWINISLGYKSEPIWLMSPFLQIGASFYDVDVSSGSGDNGISPGFEVGLMYDFSDKLTLKASYQYYDSIGNDDIGFYDSNALLLGVRYSFGRSSEIQMTPPSPEHVSESKETGFKPLMTTSETVLENIGTIFFDFDSSVFVDNGVSEVFERITQDYNGLVFIGHADSSGSDEYNYQLGLERANQVFNKFVELGLTIDKTKVHIESKGETEPMYHNSSAERNMNRRVEVYILRDVKGN